MAQKGRIRREAERPWTVRSSVQKPTSEMAELLADAIAERQIPVKAMADERKIVAVLTVRNR